MFSTKVLTENTRFSRLLSVKTGPPLYVFIRVQDGLAFYMTNKKNTMALTQLFQDSEYRSGLEDGSTKVLIKKVLRDICRTAMCIDEMRYWRKK